MFGLRLAGGVHFQGGAHIAALRAARGGQAHRAGHQADLGAGFVRGPGQGKTHLAAGQIGDAAHRVDSLVRGPGGDQHAPTGQHLGLKKRDQILEQLLGLEHAAVAGLAAGLVALTHAQHGGAVLAQLGHVTHRGRMGPHFAVHGRCQQQGHRFLGARQAHQAQEVVSAAMQQLGHEVGAGGRHQNRVGFAAEVDVRHVVGLAGVPLRDVDGPVAQGLHGYRGDELRGRLGHDHLHLRALLDQQAAQIGRLVAGHAAGQPQNNVFTV